MAEDKLTVIYNLAAEMSSAGDGVKEKVSYAIYSELYQ